MSSISTFHSLIITEEMTEEERKELENVYQYIRAERELNESKQQRERDDERRKEVNAERKQLDEECTKKDKVRQELRRKIEDGDSKIVESGGKKETHKGEIILSKNKADVYVSLISSNFYEFGKIRGMIEGKERERINKLFPEKAEIGALDSGLAKKFSSSNTEYVKPLKPVVSVTYIKVK